MVQDLDQNTAQGIFDWYTCTPIATLESAKIRNIRSNKRVAYCIDEGVRAPEIKACAGHGTAEIITGSEVSEIAKSILLRYFESMESKRAQELLDDTDCIIEITPKNSCEWSY